MTNPSVIAGPAYPLKAIPGSHYLVDQSGFPFFIQGDSPWFLTESLTQADVDYYLSNRWVQGYNSIILDITAQKNDDGQNYEGNIYGQLPFTNTIAGPFTNLLSWNVNYFTNVDWVIQRAGNYGINVFAYPLYDGYDGSGWYAQMAGNSSNAIWSYGQFIGNRYRSFSNIVWVGAGDFNEPNAPGKCLWNIVAAGIRSADTNHLITAQAARPTPASYYSAFITVNCSYGSLFPYIESLANYEQSPVLASFAREPYYENGEINGTLLNDLNCRQFAYWAVLSGDMGHFYGDELQWPFQSGWQSEMWDAAATSITNVVRLMNTRPWWNFVPDADHSTIVAGYGSSGTVDYIACAREASGRTVMAYVPQDGMVPTVDLTQVSGSSATAWWYNPRSGSATLIGQYMTTATADFSPPDNNDWVLVVDDASQNYGPPGILGPIKPSIIVDLTNSSAFVGTTTSFQILADGTPPLSYQWFYGGQNIASATSSVLTISPVTSAGAGSYQVLVTNSWGAAASFVAKLAVADTNNLTIQCIGENLFLLTLSGVPGRSYTLQSAANLSGPWQDIGSASVGPSGIFTFYASSTSLTRFYRAAYP